MNLADNLRRMQLAPAPRCDKTSREDAHRLAQVQTGMLLQRTASGNMRTPRLESPRPSTEDRREKIVIEAVEENGSWTDINHAMVASGVSDDSPPVTPPGHLCPAGHTGDGGSELYISHSGEKEQQQNAKEGLRSVKGAGERSARRTRRAAKLRSETQKQREKELTCTYIHIYIYIYIYMFRKVVSCHMSHMWYMCMSICIYIHIYIYTFRCVYVYIYIHIILVWAICI